MNVSVQRASDKQANHNVGNEFPSSLATDGEVWLEVWATARKRRTGGAPHAQPLPQQEHVFMTSSSVVGLSLSSLVPAVLCLHPFHPVAVLLTQFLRAPVGAPQRHTHVWRLGLCIGDELFTQEPPGWPQLLPRLWL